MYVKLAAAAAVQLQPGSSWSFALFALFSDKIQDYPSLSLCFPINVLRYFC